MLTPMPSRTGIAMGRPLPGGRRDMVPARLIAAGDRLSSWIALMPVIGVSGTLVMLGLVIARHIVALGAVPAPRGER